MNHRASTNCTTDTPRVDALVAPFDRASREHPELVALARQLERERADEIERLLGLLNAALAMLRECRPIVERSIDLSVNVYPAQIGLLVAIKRAIGE